MKRFVVALVSLATFAVPAICSARPPVPGPYVSGFIGASIPRDSDVTTDDYLLNKTFDDRVEFDPGLNIGGTGGYDFGLIRLEGELSYKYSEIKSITDQSDGYRFRSPEGNLGALAMMFNAFFDLHNSTPVTPYWGGGIGFAALHVDDVHAIDTRGGSTQRLLLYPKDDDTVFAYQVGGGLEIALNRQLSLDLGYRYFGTSKATFDKEWDRTVRMRFESHTAAVGFRVKF